MAEKLPLFHVLGQAYCLERETGVLRWLLRRQRGARVLQVANVHTAVSALWDPELAASQAAADLRLADGRPLSLAGRLLGCWQARQLRGPDLMASAARAGLAMRTRHFFYGGADGVAKAAAAQLKALAPGLQVAGCESPPFREAADADLERLAARLRRTRADICWVGLGAPKQEKLMARLAAFGAPCALVGVGAGFDYFGGAKREAPRWMQGLALEWLFRLAQEPGRLWWRYLSTNAPFVALFLAEYFGLHPGSRQALWVRALRLASLALALTAFAQGRCVWALAAVLAPLVWGRFAWLSGAQQ